MSTRDFTANVISATKVVPDGNFKDSKASGVWDINEALDLIKGGNWPNAANINPAAFVDALFQTHLYDGTGSNLEINNGINLSGSGGLVWVKRRNGGDGHWLVDTERGLNKSLQSHSTAANNTGSDQIVSFDSDGFTLGNRNEGQNYSGLPYVSWTFRKQPKFFDIVTYSGTGSAQAIAHSLNSTVGMILVKRTDSTANWSVYHRGANGGTDPEDYYGILNLTDEFSNNAGHWNDTAPTTTQFTVGDDTAVNASGGSYVAYLFAHNDDDGGFGEPGDQDIIKCGSYTGNGNATGPSINLGFEPQLVLIKLASHSGENWILMDNMRGMPVGSNDTLFEINDSGAEKSTAEILNLTPTGFDIKSTSNGINTNTYIYAYMAIRRGGMQTPSAASSVFTVDDGMAANTTSVPGFTANHVVDLGISTTTSSASNVTGTRLLGDTFLSTDATDAETSNSVTRTSGYQNGFFFTDGSADSTRTAWMWARARGYFDVVAYSGTGSATTVTHNLGVAPEMMWIKRRDATGFWSVYHKGVNGGSSPEDYYLVLHDNNAQFDDATIFNDTAPTSSVFSVGTHNRVNNASGTYVAYLFATVAGVSKVDSFTQSGATNVACGFSGDTPSLIILKRRDDSGNWYLFDSVRGIVAGNDPHYYLDTTGAEITNADIVDPYSGGFATTANLANGDYIFYAIAATS